MIEKLIKAATCRIKAGNCIGTGWLIAESIVITARHSVIDAITKGESIELTFNSDDGIKAIPGIVIDHNEEFDVCLLRFVEKLNISPLEISFELPAEKSHWRSFGYPAGKATIGHYIQGEIGHILTKPKMRMDMDLTVDPQYALNNYEGLSGAVVVVDNVAIGLTRLSIDSSLGAISLKSIESFITQSGIHANFKEKNQQTKTEISEFAERRAFQDKFENLILSNPGQCIFLEGAHGIGKTTFCESYTPRNTNILSLGTYSLASKERGVGPIVRVQPKVFFDWVSTAISKLVIGSLPQKQDQAYEGLVQSTAFYIQECSRYCSSKNKVGLIFIDAVNEGYSADASSMTKLIGLIPTVLPANISVIFTAPNYNLVASCFPNSINSSLILNLPRLSEISCISYCNKELRADKNTNEIVSRICEKSAGHPLYLRYLIEFVNDGNSENLDDFPVLSGSIEQYYEALWPKLLTDENAINLLAIISRFRWGIPTAQVLTLLQSVEKISFTSTISRIKHLLLEPESTEVYHSSFAEFIIDKTRDLEHEIQERIARFCLDSKSNSYGKLNVIFHFLRSEETSARNAVSLCNQSWVDESVNLGVEPDVLISDLKDVMQLAIQQAMGVEVIRLLLLLQRVEFRYNILFAQSASLIAKAFISLNKPKEAIKHVIRHRTLIVHEDEAVKIIRLLLEYEFENEAFEIIQALHNQVIQPFGDSEAGSTLNEFIAINSLYVELVAYAQLADGRDRSKKIIKIILDARDLLRNVESLEESPSEINNALARIAAPAASASMYFLDHYIQLNEIKTRNGNKELPEEYLNNLLFILSSYHMQVEEFGCPNSSSSVQNLFKDIEELSINSCQGKWRAPLIDVLIVRGASIDLINKLLKHVDLAEPKPIRLVKENGVDVVLDDIEFSLIEWRIKYFLEAYLECPKIVPFNKYKWKEYLSSLMQAIAWSEAHAAHSSSAGDTQQSNSLLDFINQQVLPNLNFDLSERILWDDSYAIPEAIVPILWERLSLIFTRYFPKHLSEFICELLERFPKQFGIYSEGFRNSLRLIFDRVGKTDFDTATSDEIYKLLEKFRVYVSEGVENRHELVPELLDLIPLYVRLGAEEQANEVFKNVLAVSMGPSWYKEDQFSLISTALSSMHVEDSLNIELARIAGYLDRASGEMTFQRFVRYEKNEFIGQLVRLNKFKETFSYFRRQSYGTICELIQDAGSGVVDRISPLVGSRFPGGALDEQLSVLHIVRNAKNIDWKLRWALLETFQCGDIRHLDDFSTEYAILINESSDDGVAAELLERLGLVVTAEISETFREQFLNSFFKTLNLKYHPCLSNPFAKEVVTDSDLIAETEEDSTTNITSSPSDEEIDDKFFMPGTFGKRSSIPKANSFLDEAETLISRKNYKAAKSKAVNALKELQDGGWPIWGNLSGSSHRAEAILREASEANEVIQYYGPLILDERFTARWSIAEHLMSKVGNLFDSDSKLQMLNIVLEHMGLMVGESKFEISNNRYLNETSTINSPDKETFNFLVWLSDHPQWRRREKIGPLIVWLIKEDNSYFEIAAKQAFKNDYSYSSDFMAVAIDVLSTQDSLETYRRLDACIDIKSAAMECRNFTRLMILNQVGNRAASKGNQDAKDINSIINNKFSSGYVEADYIDVPSPLPDWLECISPELKFIAQMKLFSKALLEKIESELSLYLAPISIEVAWEIESALSRSFREVEDWPLNRWEGKVRHALSSAVLEFCSQSKLKELDAALRIYNPYTSELKIDKNYISNGTEIINSIVNNNDYRTALGNQESLYLHYQELITVKSDSMLSHTTQRLEIYSVIVDKTKLRKNIGDALLSFHRGRRQIIEFEGIGLTSTIYLSEFKYFGVLTPATPSSLFMGIIKTNPKDLTRKVWRNGRSYSINDMGRPELEGSFLAVKRSAINLPKNIDLVWMISIGGQTVAVDINNKRIM